jgi:O-antigen/teichoic acid export membrane protein
VTAAAGPSPLGSVRRRLLAGGAWAVGGQLATAVLGLPTGFVLARLLTPSDMGNFVLALSLAWFGTTVGCVGLNQVMVRFVAESLATGRPERAGRVVRLVFRLGVPGAATSGLLYAAFGGAFEERVFDAPVLVALTGLVACWIVALCLQSLVADAFRGWGDLRRASLFGGPLATALLLGGLATLWAVDGRAELGDVLVLLAGSVLASCLAGGWALRRKLRTLPAGTGKEPDATTNGSDATTNGSDASDTSDGVRAARVLRIALPLLVSNVSLIAFSQADLWIMGAFRPKQEVAVYGVISRVVAVVAAPNVILSAVMPPLVAELYARGRRRELERVLRTTATAAAVPSLAATVVFVVAGGPLLGIVYGGFYGQGAFALALLSLGQLATVWFGSCGIALVMSGHHQLMLALSIATGVLTVAAELAVVRSTGIVGVAAASAAGIALLHVATWAVVRARTGVRTHAAPSALPELLQRALERPGPPESAREAVHDGA